MGNFMIPVQSCQDDGFSTGFLGSFVVANLLCWWILALKNRKIVTSWATNQIQGLYKHEKMVVFMANLVGTRNPCLFSNIWYMYLHWPLRSDHHPNKSQRSDGYSSNPTARKKQPPEVEVRRPQHNIPTPRSGPSFKSMLDSTVPAKHVDLRDLLRFSLKDFFVGWFDLWHHEKPLGICLIRQVCWLDWNVLDHNV